MGRPDPPHGHEGDGEERQLRRLQVAVVQVSQLVSDNADGGDEDQVEEELEPGRVAMLVEVLHDAAPTVAGSSVRTGSSGA